MKRYFIFIISSFFVIGCTSNSEKQFYELLNDQFLSFVDTTAYRTGRLIQVPNDTVKYTPKAKVVIQVDALYAPSSEMRNSILHIIKAEKLNEFSALLSKPLATTSDTIAISKVTNTGKYTLISSSGVNKVNKSTIVGKIRFYKPFISADKAILILEIMDSEKAGFSECYFLKKQNTKWEIIKSQEMIRW